MQDLIAAGFNELAYDIIERAEKDRRNRPLEDCYWVDDNGNEFGCGEINLRCVKHFFTTEWFEGLCELASRDVYAIRRLYR